MHQRHELDPQIIHIPVKEIHLLHLDKRLFRRWRHDVKDGYERAQVAVVFLGISAGALSSGIFATLTTKPSIPVAVLSLFAALATAWFGYVWRRETLRARLLEREFDEEVGD